MDPVFRAAKAARHVGVDLHINLLGTLTHSSHVRDTRTEIEVTVLIHRGNLEHSHVDRPHILAVVARKLGIADRGIVSQAGIDRVTLNTGHMPGVPDKMLLRLRNLINFRHTHQNAAADLHILQLSHACRQGTVNLLRRGDAPAVIHPIPGLDGGCRLLGRNQFLLVFLCKTHRKKPLPTNNCPPRGEKQLRRPEPILIHYFTL